MRRIKDSMVVAVCLLFVMPVHSGELAGVTMDDQITVAGETLRLNGMGLRKKLWVKVYVAGLYLADPTDDAQAVLSAPGPKKIVMHFLTNKATKKKMDAAWFEGFEANSPESYSSIQAKVNTFADLFGDMKEHDVIELTIIPDQGTHVMLNGVEKAVIEGDDFATALLKVWLGDQPPAEELKAALLGK